MRKSPKTGLWLLAFTTAAAAVGGIIVHAEGQYAPDASSPAYAVSPSPPPTSASSVSSAPSAQPAASPSASPLEPSSRQEVPKASDPKPKPEDTKSPTPPDKPKPQAEDTKAPAPQAKPKPKQATSPAGVTPVWAAGSLPSQTVKRGKNGLAVVTNPSSLYVLVNKKRNLPADYVPKDLTVPDVPFSFSGDSPKKLMRKEAADDLEKLFAGAKKAGIELKAVSGYRSYATQKAIFDRNAAAKGAEAANRTSAHPGQSEHQTGLAMDISSASVHYALEQSFGDTKEGRWLAKHAAEYGFVIRYPKGKEKITGYSYEPWHVRYLGKEAAAAAARSNLTLEAFFDKLEASATKA